VAVAQEQGQHRWRDHGRQQRHRHDHRVDTLVEHASRKAEAGDHHADLAARNHAEADDGRPTLAERDRAEEATGELRDDGDDGDDGEHPQRAGAAQLGEVHLGAGDDEEERREEGEQGGGLFLQLVALAGFRRDHARQEGADDGREVELHREEGQPQAQREHDRQRRHRVAGLVEPARATAHHACTAPADHRDEADRAEQGADQAADVDGAAALQGRHHAEQEHGEDIVDHRRTQDDACLPPLQHAKLLQHPSGDAGRRGDEGGGDEHGTNPVEAGAVRP